MSEQLIHIYRATRGKYLKPIPISEAMINWITENGRKMKPSKKIRCSHPKHSDRKQWYPYSEMFYQRYHLTKKELIQAVKEYDMASLEQPNRIICAICAKKQKS